MPAPVPFTLLLAPNGDVLYQELGAARYREAAPRDTRQSPRRPASTRDSGPTGPHAETVRAERMRSHPYDTTRRRRALRQTSTSSSPRARDCRAGGASLTFIAAMRRRDATRSPPRRHAAAASGANLEYPVLPIGSPMPDFALPGIDGKTHKAERVHADEAPGHRLREQPLSRVAALRRPDRETPRRTTRPRASRSSRSTRTTRRPCVSTSWATPTSPTRWPR